MAKLPRYHGKNLCHYVTTVTRNRKPIFRTNENVKILTDTIAFYRNRGDFLVLGYVVMPDHLHALIVPQKGSISDIMRNIKAYSGNEIRNELSLKSDVWQDSFYDHIVADQADLISRLHYMHRNPFRKGIVEDLALYPYSSYINYYTEDEPILEIDILR